jgi:L-amino acid N-acyltransferase YncA
MADKLYSRSAHRNRRHLAVMTGVAEAVGLGFASYSAHEARPNTRSTSEKRFEDTIGRKQS